VGLIAIAAIVVLEAVCWGLAFGIPSVSGTFVFWLLTCAPTIVVGIASIVYAVKKKLVAAWLKPRVTDMLLGVGVAALQYGMAYVAAKYVVPSLPDGPRWLTGLYGYLGTTAQRQSQPILSLLALLVTCGCEEIVWRGFAADVAQQRFGARWAFVIQVLANTAVYLPMAIVSKNPIIPCSAFVGGIATGILAVKLKNRLWGPILGHGLFDFSVVVLWPLVP
jgi:membrane protease YdiL (CAAX protease family)